MPGTPLNRDDKSEIDKLQVDKTENIQENNHHEYDQHRQTTAAVRELTQTDRLNKRLLESVLERMSKSDEFDKFLDKHELNANDMDKDNDSDHASRSDNDTNNLVNGRESADENEQDENEGNDDVTSRRIDPETSRKRIVRNPIPKLNTARLRGPKGVHTIEKYFEGFKFGNKGEEKNDLDRIMKRLEHWAHRLFPKYQFDDFLEKVEVLGGKRDLQTFLTKYRHDMLSDDAIIPDVDGDAVVEREQSPQPVDEFDLLIAEQITKTKQVTMSQSNQLNNNMANVNMQSTILTSNNQNSNTLNVISNDEIKKRIERNKQLAIERRHARLKRNEEMKRGKIEESSVACDGIIQTSYESQTYENKSIVEAGIVGGEKSAESINKIVSSDENDCVDINSTMDKNNLALNNQPILNQNISAKPLLTDEELNKTIDDAVNQFMKRKRQ